MTDKTRLEEELEIVQTRKGRWGLLSIILLVLLLGALGYTVHLNRKLLDAHQEINTLKMEMETLKIKMEALKLEGLRCADEVDKNTNPTDTPESPEITEQTTLTPTKPAPATIPSSSR
ncbi:MAG: hypothetical protein D6726_03635 [Nitrospirae bacterium]|nr:MAG: hypothetical protein D6726_03635 [Nitrospirota bacterium]